MKKLFLPALLLGFLVFGHNIPTAKSAAPCDPQNDTCPIPIDVTYDAPVATSTGFSVRMTASNMYRFNVYACVGTYERCINGSTIANTEYWKSLGGALSDDLPLNKTVTFLRPNTTYPTAFFRFVVTGTFPSTQNASLGSITTLPAFTPSSSTPSNLQPTSARIDWSTAFSGSSEVTYGFQPASWNEEDIPFGTTGISKMSVQSNGNIWALGGASEVSQYSAGLGWSPPVSLSSLQTGFIPYAMDTAGSSTAMVVGLASGGPAALWWRGSSWQALTPPGTNWLINVKLSGPQSAWAVGANEQVFHFDGTTWVDRSDTSGQRINGQAFQTIFSLDDKTVLVGGTAGRLGLSNNAGLNWTYTTLPNAGTAYVTNISSVDGQTFWASGTNGKVWKCIMTNGVCAWTSETIASGIATASIQILAVKSPTSVLFAIPSAPSLGYPGPLITYNATTQTSVIDSSITDLGGQSGQSSVFAYSPDTTIFAAGSFTGSSGKTFAARKAIYGTPAGDSDPSFWTNNHQVTLTNLVAGRTYYYSAVSSATGITSGVQGTFTLPAPDTVDPTVSITTPNTTTYTKNPTFAVAGSARDNTALQSVTLSNNGTNLSLTTVPSLTTNPAALTWSSSVTLSPGNNALVATATDTSANFATANRNIILDTQAPSLSITAPVNGSTQNITPIAVGGTATDNNGVTSMDYQLNAGPVVNITPPVGGTWTSSIPTPISGLNHLTVHAYDAAGNLATATVDFTYAAPTFSLNVNPSAPTSVPIGQALNYTITGVPANSFAFPVSLTAAVVDSSSNPVSVPISFTPVSMTVGPSNGTSAMAITTTGQNPDTYTVTITGTGGGKTATATVTYTLTTPANFTLSASPNAPGAPNIVAGQTGSFTISVSANTTFAGTVTLSTSGFPSGVTGTLSPSSVTLTNNQLDSGTQLSVATTAAAAPGSYAFTLQGVSGALTQSITVPFTVVAAPDILLTLSPATRTVTAGSLPATFYSGSVESQHGFTGPVNLLATESTGRAGITLDLSRNSLALTDGSSVPFIIDALASSVVPAGTYHITILACTGTIVGTACSSGIQKTTTVDLVVNPDATAPVISQIVASPNDTQVTVTWQTDEPSTGVVTIFTDAALQNLVSFSGDNVCTGTPCTHTVVISGLTQLTQYFFTVSATDLAPNPPGANTSLATTQAGVQLQFTTLATPDRVPPTLTVTSPAASATPTSILGQVSINGSASDDVAMGTVEIHITSQPTTLWPTGLTKIVNCQTASCDPFGYNWVTDASVPNGTYQIEVTAYDRAGNPSIPIQRFVQVANDFSIPLVLTGPDVVVSSTCGTGSCSATISWTTNSMTTSLVDYGITITSCDPATGRCTYPSQVAGDDSTSSNPSDATAPRDPSRLMTTHRVTLNNLEPKQIYHFRITSCNGNGICTN